VNAVLYASRFDEAAFTTESALKSASKSFEKLEKSA
jgi:hypothetical protein